MMLLIYILAAYIATFTVAMYQLEYLHGKQNTASPNERDDAGDLLMRALYMTLPTCYYLTLLYAIWYIIYSLVIMEQGQEPVPVPFVDSQ